MQIRNMEENARIKIRELQVRHGREIAEVREEGKREGEEMKTVMR